MQRRNFRSLFLKYGALPAAVLLALVAPLLFSVPATIVQWWVALGTLLIASFNVWLILENRRISQEGRMPSILASLEGTQVDVGENPAGIVELKIHNLSQWAILIVGLELRPDCWDREVEGTIRPTLLVDHVSSVLLKPFEVTAFEDLSGVFDCGQHKKVRLKMTFYSGSGGARLYCYEATFVAGPHRGAGNFYYLKDATLSAC